MDSRTRSRGDGSAHNTQSNTIINTKTCSFASKPRRQSIFREIGLDEDIPYMPEAELQQQRASRRTRFQHQPKKVPSSFEENENEYVAEEKNVSTSRHESQNARPIAQQSAADPAPSRLLSFPRLAMLATIIAVTFPSLQRSKSGDIASVAPVGAEGGLIRWPEGKHPVLEAEIEKRADSPTEICTRWSQQTAVINGTMYIYGGRITTEADQTSDTWNNDFLTLDLTKTWQISTPTLEGLPQPSGPPAVANGYLWNSYDSLYLYGGEFSDTPATSPVAFSMWEYDLGSSSWTEYASPSTSAGDNSDGGGQAVQRAAEGAGFSVPELGRGWYFGGHLDGYTTEGWSQWIARVYLKSLLEFTFPGYSNDAVTSLASGATAGTGGVWRNITEGGLQDTAGFPERADGVLVFVPGYGDQGIILGLAGGTNESFTQMNVIDVYDIATSTWYKQATSGSTPEIRVNPCAVAASAADGSSTQVYMFGGQNLIPYGNQTQYNDMWILTIPAFTWIKVDESGQSVPPARAGHTCNIWNAQVVVVGGYVGTDLSCDSPGIYVFDASELSWVNQYTALDGSNDLNQQASQDGDTKGLSGSYGYSVPDAVISVIGGSAAGGATITKPIETATAGPLATGTAITYTVTGSNGATVTETGTSTSGSGSSSGIGSGSSSDDNSGKSGPNVAAIVAGVIAALFACLAAYLGFCAWVYRRQLALYKNHVSMAQRVAAGAPNEKSNFLAAASSSEGRGTNSSDRPSAVGSSGAQTGASSSGAGTMGAGGIGMSTSGGRNSSVNSSSEDLLEGQEPTFLGVLLSPRRSLRVINRD